MLSTGKRLLGPAHGYVGGAVEFGMMQAGAAQLAHSCHVPIYGSGGMSDSKLPDAQAGYETGIFNLLTALSGGEIIIECISSALEDTVVSVYEQAVISNEICDMVYRILPGN
jgi:trimethylamine--corrinoid protein Co-methyltransferase